MVLTIYEAAKLDKGNDLKQAIVELYARSSGLLRVLPFMPIQGNSWSYNQEETLPGVGFRGVNEGYTESVGVLNPITERLHILGGDIDVDKFIVDTMGQQQRSVQTSMKVKAISQLFTYKFIKGDSEANPKEIDGLQTRLQGDQVVSNGGSSGGDPLSLGKLDEVIDAVDDPTHLLMNKAMRRILKAAARDTGVSGYISYKPDEFGRDITHYADLPIILTDENTSLYKGTAFDEAATGGGSTATSIYVASFGEGQLTGLENGGMDVRNLGEVPDKPVYRTRCEMYAGVALHNPRCAARLRDISNAAAVA